MSESNSISLNKEQLDILKRYKLPTETATYDSIIQEVEKLMSVVKENITTKATYTDKLHIALSKEACSILVTSKLGDNLQIDIISTVLNLSKMHLPYNAFEIQDADKIVDRISKLKSFAYRYRTHTSNIIYAYLDFKACEDTLERVQVLAF